MGDEILRAGVSTAEMSVDDICQDLGIRPYIFRFWTTEFPELGPDIIGDRHTYGSKQLHIARKIYGLLYNEKSSLLKAKEIIRDWWVTQQTSGAFDVSVSQQASAKTQESDTFTSLHHIPSHTLSQADKEYLIDELNILIELSSPSHC